MYNQKVLITGIATALAMGALSCSKDHNGGGSAAAKVKAGKYLLGIGITTSSGSGSTTANYAVPADDLTTGTITPVGNGLTLTGYRDYTQGNNTVFALGGLGVTDVDALSADAQGYLSVSGTTSLTDAADDMLQVDDQQMLELEYPAKADGDQAVFNYINIDSKAISKSYSSLVEPLTAGGDYPIYTGIAINGNLAFVSYMHFNDSYKTNHVDTNYVAVYSYPDMTYKNSIYDTRTGPSGAWATRDGLFKDEKGDIYAMSACDMTFTQSDKPRGFLRIKNGDSTFDKSYFFKPGDQNGKISHIKYVGNGKAFAIISTVNINRASNQWSDSAVKMSIVDVYNQTVTDVKLAGGTVNDLIHTGNGGRSFSVLSENGKVYYAATIGNSTNIYVIDVATATATKGAEVDGTFVGGIFDIEQ